MGDFLAAGEELGVVPADAGEEGVGLAGGVDGEGVEAEVRLGFGGDGAAEGVADELAAEADADDGQLRGMGLLDELGFLLHPGELGDVGDVHRTAEDEQGVNVVEIRRHAARTWQFRGGHERREVGPADVEGEAVVAEDGGETAGAGDVGMLEDEESHGGW